MSDSCPTFSQTYVTVNPVSAYRVSVLFESSFVLRRTSPDWTGLLNAIDEDWPDSFVYFLHQPGRTQARASKDPAVQRPPFPPGM